MAEPEPVRLPSETREPHGESVRPSSLEPQAIPPHYPQDQQPKRRRTRRILIGAAFLELLLIVLAGAVYVLSEFGGSAEAVAPARLRVEAIGVDASIEVRDIVDGVMQDPTGAFTVAWYDDLGYLGTTGNVVLAGHLDFWDVGQAVFYDLWEVKPGQIIQVVGENDDVFEFRVDWVRSYVVDDLTRSSFYEILGPTGAEAITLITCGGPFDYQTGEYLERLVVRGTRID